MPDEPWLATHLITHEWILFLYILSSKVAWYIFAPSLLSQLTESFLLFENSTVKFGLINFFLNVELEQIHVLSVFGF